MYNCFFLLYNFKIHILPPMSLTNTYIEHGKWKCIHGWFLRANWSSLWTRNILMNTNMQEVDDPVSLLYTTSTAQNRKLQQRCLVWVFMRMRLSSTGHEGVVKQQANIQWQTDVYVYKRLCWTGMVYGVGVVRMPAWDDGRMMLRQVRC